MTGWWPLLPYGSLQGVNLGCIEDLVTIGDLWVNGRLPARCCISKLFNLKIDSLLHLITIVMLRLHPAFF